MDEILTEVLRLQPGWSHKNTPEMQRRGQLIRNAGPDWLSGMSGPLAAAIGIDEAELIIEGRDGTGQKTEVPWFRFGSRVRSPSATIGWYCVYLFDTLGEVAYLSLAHGATTWTGVDFEPRPTEDLRTLAEWARAVVGETGESANLGYEMHLHSRRSPLGDLYEAGTGLCKGYRIGHIPSNNQLRHDALAFAEMLGRVYRAADQTPSPVGPAPEVADAVESAQRTAGRPGAVRGQGFRIGPDQRASIERHAMSVARALLEDWGWEKIEDVSSTEPCDFRCSSGPEELWVEVKGTTSIGERVILTRGEVDHHRTVHPNNALVVVSGIQLEDGDPPSASGGVPQCWTPWEIPGDDLTVISYLYDVPRQAADLP